MHRVERNVKEFPTGVVMDTVEFEEDQIPPVEENPDIMPPEISKKASSMSDINW